MKDATLTITLGKSAWLLSCEPSRTWVAYQPNADAALPLTLECPVGRVTCEGFPLGKLAVTQTADGAIKIDVDAEPSVLKLESKVTAASASFNGTAAETTRDSAGNWIIRTK